MRDILVKRIEVLSGFLFTYVYFIGTDGKRYEYDVTRNLRGILMFKLSKVVDSYTVYVKLLDTIEYHIKNKPKNSTIINFQTPIKINLND